MRAVVQRVTQASVSVDGDISGSIERGMMVLLGIASDDTNDDAEYIVKKLLGLRIFDDDAGVMNISIKDRPGYGILLVSQFTLYGDCRKGNRPSYIQAMPPQEAKVMYGFVLNRLTDEFGHIEAGVFQAEMDVAIHNDGPVTILLDSRKGF